MVTFSKFLLRCKQDIIRNYRSLKKTRMKSKTVQNHLIAIELHGCITLEDKKFIYTKRQKVFEILNLGFMLIYQPAAESLINFWLIFLSGRELPVLRSPEVQPSELHV